jgi:dienelactone hydrolase
MKTPQLARTILIHAAFFACAGLCSTGHAAAEIRAQNVDYKQGDTVLEGYLAYDDTVTGKRPGVLLVPTRNGLDAFARTRTEALAKLGYVGFAADIFGKGIRPTNVAEAQEQSAKYGKDRPLARLRAQAALDTLRGQPMVDTESLAVIGFCFGGMVALELARSGAPLLATVTFHGTLNTPTPDDAKNIKGRVLVLHGAEDPVAPMVEVQALIKEMRDAKVDFGLELYGGVVHGYTNPQNGTDASKSSAYNERADKRSWTAMQELFKEVFVK